MRAYRRGKPMTTSCSCASPPGGKISCPANHFAFCDIIKGEVSGGCLDPGIAHKPRASELRRITRDVVISIRAESDQSVVIRIASASTDAPGGLVDWDDTNALTQLLSYAVESGLTVTISGTKEDIAQPRHYPTEFSIRLTFPASWSRFGSTPAGGALTA